MRYFLGGILVFLVATMVGILKLQDSSPACGDREMGFLFRADTRVPTPPPDVEAAMQRARASAASVRVIPGRGLFRFSAAVGKSLKDKWP